MFHGNLLFLPQKILGILFRTIKSPLYEGCNVLVLAKSRTKTYVQVCKSLGTYVGLGLWAGELYVKFAILDISRSTNEVMSKIFCEGRRKNYLGSLNVVPYTISADEHFMLSFTTVQSP